MWWNIRMMFINYVFHLSQDLELSTSSHCEGNSPDNFIYSQTPWSDRWDKDYYVGCRCITVISLVSSNERIISFLTCTARNLKAHTWWFSHKCRKHPFSLYPKFTSDALPQAPLIVPTLSQNYFTVTLATKAARKIPADFELKKHVFLSTVHDIIEKNDIPPQLVINWDQTG